MPPVLLLLHFHALTTNLRDRALVVLFLIPLGCINLEIVVVVLFIIIQEATGLPGGDELVQIREIGIEFVRHDSVSLCYGVELTHLYVQIGSIPCGKSGGFPPDCLSDYRNGTRFRTSISFKNSSSSSSNNSNSAPMSSSSKNRRWASGISCSA